VTTAATRAALARWGDMEFFIVLSLLTLVNVGLVGINVKLYTEILKDKNQDRRTYGTPGTGG
jgi:hypothetical protein